MPSIGTLTVNTASSTPFRYSHTIATMGSRDSRDSILCLPPEEVIVRRATRVEASIFDWWNYRHSPSQRIRYTTSLIIATAHELLLLEAFAENAVKPAKL
jgi:hypothetical protein